MATVGERVTLMDEGLGRWVLLAMTSASRISATVDAVVDLDRTQRSYATTRLNRGWRPREGRPTLCAGLVMSVRRSSSPARTPMSLAPLSSGEGKAGGLVVEQGLKDGIGEAALEYPKCLASAVPTALAPFDHPFGRRMPTGLGECDAV